MTLKLMGNSPAGVQKLGWSVLFRSFGSGLLQSCLLLYYVGFKGLPAAEVGLYMSAGNLFGLLSSTPLSKKITWNNSHIIASIGLAGCGILAYFTYWASSLVIVSIIAFGTSMMDNLFYTSRGVLIISLASKEERPIVTAKVRTVLNGASMAGALLSGVILAINKQEIWHLAWISIAFFYLLGAFIMFTIKPKMKEGSTPEIESSWIVLKDKRYLFLCFWTFILTLEISQLTIGLPLWLLQSKQLPEWLFSTQLALTTLLVLTLQIFVAKRYITKAQSLRGMKQASGLFLVTSVIFGISLQFPAFIAITLICLAVVVYTLAEMVYIAASWVLSYEMAPENAHNQYQGVFSFSILLGYALGPGLVSTSITKFDIYGWISVGLLGVAVAMLSRVKAN